MKPSRFENGLTVAQLKAILADWPDADEDGTPYEVWVGNGLGVSNQAKEIWPLNMRADFLRDLGGDLLLLHD